MGRYRVVYADPPWQIESFPGAFSDAVRKMVPVPYPMMTVDEICALRVRDIASPDAVLFLWTINAYLEDSYRVARAWGFKPSTMIVWAKPQRGRGFGGTFATTTEYLLFAKRGRVSSRDRLWTTWFEAKRGRHSRKPDLFRQLIERCFDGPRIELFARESFLGWDAWGNEIESDIELAS